jgi:opacity protein-like surface antigen
MIRKFSRFIFLLLIIFQQAVFAGEPPVSKAVGVFLAAGVGPRFPIGQFANSTDLGYGLMVDLSYTDSDNLPFFIFARLGYEQFPGSQDFYQESDYSNYSTTITPASLGIRYYFSPLVESTVLVIPVVEGSVSYTYFQVLNEFESDANKTNYTDDLWKFGGTVGAGLSMFIMEIMANYTYYESNQYISINLNVRLPLFVNL